MPRSCLFSLAIHILGPPRPTVPTVPSKTLDLPELGKAAPQAPRQGAHGTLGDRAMETEPARDRAGPWT